MFQIYINAHRKASNLIARSPIRRQIGRVGGVSRALQKPLRLDHSHASMAAALALHGFAGAAFEHPQWGCAEAPVSVAMDPIGRASRSLQGDIGATEPGLKPGGLLPLYTTPNFYTDHPEIPAAEKKYFARKIRARPSASRNETWCKKIPPSTSKARTHRKFTKDSNVVKKKGVFRANCKGCEAFQLGRGLPF